MFIARSGDLPGCDFLVRERGAFCGSLCPSEEARSPPNSTEVLKLTTMNGLKSVEVYSPLERMERIESCREIIIPLPHPYYSIGGERNDRDERARGRRHS